jgi:hypothetical protein
MTTLKKTILSSLFALSVAGVGGGVAWADSHCSCDQSCTEACAKGDTKACKCKTCDCEAGKGCSHHQCEHEGAHKHDQKKSEKKK